MNAIGQTEDFDISSIPMEFSPLHTLDGGGREKLYAGDNKLFVQFSTQAVLNPSASTKAGRPIHDDVDMITIRTPGSQLTSIVAPVTAYMDRFGTEYRKWKETQVQGSSGTLLESFPFLMTKPSLIAELKYRNIFSVEQLAELPDSGKQTIMGGHELCKKAKEWLEKTSVIAADTEKEELKTRLADMETKLASMGDTPVKTRRRRNAGDVKLEAKEIPSFMS